MFLKITTHKLNEKNELHCKDGPAVEYENGTQVWYLNNQLHREDGPAFNGKTYKAWYKHGQRHRKDGPAIEYPDGLIEYYINDKKHRLDGPAVIYPDGEVEYWINNVKYDPKSEEYKLQKTICEVAAKPDAIFTYDFLNEL